VRLSLGDERSGWEFTGSGLMSSSFADMGEGDIEGEVSSEEDRFMGMNRLVAVEGPVSLGSRWSALKE
jgi:hypothetical protein